MVGCTPCRRRPEKSALQPRSLNRGTLAPSNRQLPHAVTDCSHIIHPLLIRYDYSAAFATRRQPIRSVYARVAGALCLGGYGRAALWLAPLLLYAADAHAW